MSGHCHSLSHRYSNTLTSYLQLLYLYPNEQLILFLVSNYFIFMSLQSHTSLKTDCYLKGISLYSHFIQQRLQYLSNIIFSSFHLDIQNEINHHGNTFLFEISIENTSKFLDLSEKQQLSILFINVNIVIEIYYNLCLLLNSIKLNHLCTDYLYKILKLYDKYQMKNIKCLLIEESAHLLINILRESNNENKALEVMIEYLNYD